MIAPASTVPPATSRALAEFHEQPGWFQIGDLVLDRGKREVSRAGQTIYLPRLSYRMFEAFAAAAPNVLTTDDLIEVVWSGRVVAPETVTQRVKLLRRALGDDAARPRYIALARGEGYRMLPPVLPLERSVASNAVGRSATRLKLPRAMRGQAALAVLALVTVCLFWTINRFDISPVADGGNVCAQQEGLSGLRN